MIKNSIVIANLSWNNSGWEKPIANPKAHHKYAKKFPGHESLNFKFNKKIDNKKSKFEQRYKKNRFILIYIPFCVCHLVLFCTFVIRNIRSQFHDSGW